MESKHQLSQRSEILSEKEPFTVTVLTVAFQVSLETTKIISLASYCWDPACKLQSSEERLVADSDLPYVDVCVVSPSFGSWHCCCSRSGTSRVAASCPHPTATLLSHLLAQEEAAGSHKDAARRKEQPFSFFP